MRQQGELIELRITSKKLERSLSVKEHEIEEMLERLKNFQQKKSEEKRITDIAKRERNYLAESMKELKVMIDNALES